MTRGKCNHKELINLFTYPLINFKSAFTLAEVLITLGIIGVVAAMTIPNLITTHQKKVTVTKLQKAISVLNQAYRLSYDDVGEPESAFNLGNEEYFKTYWAPYIKVLTYCSSYKVCGYKSSLPFRYVDNSNVNASVYDHTTRTSFITADGFLYIVYIANYNSSGDRQPFYWVLLDINGGHLPNRVGRDVFLLTRIQQDGGGIRPFGYNLSFQYIKNGCKSKGDYCAAYIQQSGWKIPKDYPWKLK